MELCQELHEELLLDEYMAMQSTSSEDAPSESSLNPNALEFVPGYMRSSDEDEEMEEELEQLQQQPAQQLSSNTTLVGHPIELVGDAETAGFEHVETINSLQRQLFNWLGELGKQELPLVQLQLSLLPNGQGINVQFLAKQTIKPLDERFCRAAALKLPVEPAYVAATRPGNQLTAQFLQRMSQVLLPEQPPPSSPRKTPLLSKQNSLAELEIERQIAYIKKFEQLIKQDEGKRYHQAFNELCQKLGLSSVGKQPPAKPAKSSSSSPQSQSYDWDDYDPSYAAMKIYKHAAPRGSEPHFAKQPKDRHTLEVPTTTPANSSANMCQPTQYPKLINNAKLLSAKDKDKDNKLQRWRQTIQRTMATTKSNKQQPQQQQRATLPRSGFEAQTLLSSKAAAWSNKIDAYRSSLAHNKTTQPPPAAPPERLRYPERVDVYPVSMSNNNKSTKTAPTRVTRSTKSAATTNGTQRLLLPRSTHASQMRQSEVKRRLNLMRNDKDTDVQFNEYLFK
ncbi:CG6441 [Drosophila busckii]|uniref:CG6441 n=1 Tax=Drosophila busckii TaxID=30019 RepID=A0A0M4EQ51_DROBS|nr:uncharacterized protein LOC108607721 [Drosophila busckii]ALC38832.1 CG6441 [Drosophila busckii]